jgi:hypothetical protein
MASQVNLVSHRGGICPEGAHLCLKMLTILSERLQGSVSVFSRFG